MAEPNINFQQTLTENEAQEWVANKNEYDFPIEEIPEAIQIAVKDFCLQFLEYGRKGWDIPHTEAVVHYAVQLAIYAGVDPLVMFVAAWFHDTGYYDLFKDGESSVHANVSNKKVEHMIQGVENVRIFFISNPKLAQFFGKERIDKIKHLVGVHDNIQALTTLEELILMEADSLGALDVNRVTPTYSPIEGLTYLFKHREKRYPRFITNLGKAYRDALISLSENHYLEKYIVVQTPTES